MKPVFMASFKQTSPWDFEIKWSDGVKSSINLAHLQKTCPCASCNQMRQQTQNTLSVKGHVKAKRVASVGRYAIRVQFDSGCSQGIYTYDQLRNLHLSSVK